MQEEEKKGQRRDKLEACIIWIGGGGKGGRCFNSHHTDLQFARRETREEDGAGTE